MHVLRYSNILSSTNLAPVVDTLTADAAVGITVNQHLFARRLRATDLATLLNLSRSTVTRKLHGQVGWSLQELLTLADFFRIHISDLMPMTDGEGGFLPAPFKPGYAKAPASAGATGWAHRESNPEPTD